MSMIPVSMYRASRGVEVGTRRILFIILSRIRFCSVFFVFCWVSGLSCVGDYGDYHKVSNIRRTLVGNEIDDHSDVVGASPIGTAPTTSSISI